MEIEGRYCILNVKKGRKNLEKAVKKSPIKAVVYLIIYEAGNDSGVSTDFYCGIEKVETIPTL